VELVGFWKGFLVKLGGVENGYLSSLLSRNPQQTQGFY
jgi:hypothetical protein